MIEIRNGDLLDVAYPAIGHGVNCAGVMGAGVAALVRDRFPESYQRYRELCRSGLMSPGTSHHCRENGRDLIHLATQDRPGPHARVRWIYSAVADALITTRYMGIPELAIPWLGCGIGGLTREQVLPALWAAVDASSGHTRLVIVQLPEVPA